MEQGEIKKAITGEPFTVLGDNGDISLEPIKKADFWYYYQLWEDWHYFGLPEGTPKSMPKWYLAWLKICQKWHDECKVKMRSDAYKPTVNK